MTRRVLFSSVARISDLASEPFDDMKISRQHWEVGDYVVGEASIARGGFANVELDSGRIAKAASGDLVLGALGVRHATLEVVGSWEHIGDDGHMDMLTAGGLLGRATSVSAVLPKLMRLDYRGHAMRGGKKLCMRNFARSPLEPFGRHRRPTIMLIGTSMSAGKTTAARVIIGQLVRAGRKVIGAKLTGAGRYRDILAMRDAGAQDIFDFVDVGMASSIGPADVYRGDLRNLLGVIAEHESDVLVAEVGASPLEPYNGEVALEELGDAVRLTVLCASDPYAVVGVMQGFGIGVDLVAGVATSTSAGIQVVEKLTGVAAINLLDPAAMPQLNELLEAKLRR